MANIQIVVFKVGSENFGIDIEQVLEIIDPQQVYKVPESPAFVEGISNIRNMVCLVINLRTKFKLPSREHNDNTKIIVTGSNSSPVGLLVDEVSEVMWIDDSVIDRTPESLAKYEKKDITGIAKLENNIILIVDANQFIEKLG
jgi:purine-binding chemotaxis protein CheW